MRLGSSTGRLAGCGFTGGGIHRAMVQLRHTLASYLVRLGFGVVSLAIAA